MPSPARAKFEGLLDYVSQLLEIHGRLQAGRGRRFLQEALHRSGVVLSVAAWEAFVEDLARNVLEVTGPARPALPHMRRRHEIGHSFVRKKIEQLRTPDAANVRSLYRDAFGFDPTIGWSWRAPRRRWDVRQMADGPGDWLRIRNAVAHGDTLPQNIIWLRGPGGQTRLVRGHLKECVAYFRNLALQTEAEVLRVLAANFRVTPPW